MGFKGKGKGKGKRLGKPFKRKSFGFPQKIWVGASFSKIFFFFPRGNPQGNFGLCLRKFNLWGFKGFPKGGFLGAHFPFKNFLCGGCGGEKNLGEEFFIFTQGEGKGLFWGKLGNTWDF